MTASAKDLIEIVSNEVGYHEGRDANGNWNNNQKYSDELPGFDWSDYQAWCDTFASWGFWKSGLSEDQAPRSASCDASWAAWLAMKRVSEYPAIGAQVLFGVPGDMQHTGIVAKFDANRIWTIEGNTNSTGSYQGDGVYAKVHDRRDPRVRGYGYPIFSHPIVSADPKWKTDPAHPEPTPEPPPAVEMELLKAGHLSGRYSLPSPQQRHDAEKIFNRARKHGLRWLTGTEAGNPAVITALTGAAEIFGFRIHIKREGWVAVDRDFIKSNFRPGFVPVLGSDEGQGRHSDRGITFVEFDTENLGHVSIGSSHYLTDEDELNLRLARAIGAWARKQGAKDGIVFYGGDQNLNDRRVDTFMGAPLTSLNDEVHVHEDTHQGGGPADIDVMASFDGDKRVEGKDLIVDDDSEFNLFSDHHLLVGTWKVRVLA